MSKTILVVDDAESLRTMVKHRTQEGTRVATASPAASSSSPARAALILLDLMMPDGGFGSTAHNRDGDAPVILTAK
jgi:CheY-like chemotaxis protein